MNAFKQCFVLLLTIQCFQIVVPKPIFKGLSFKKNYEMEISAIPFKHISFIKEKWFPFKMIGLKHDIAKREVAEDPNDDNLYGVNEVIFDNEENDNFPGVLTSVKNNLDVNSDGEVIPKPAPVVENIQPIHIKPVFETENVATGIMHTSSVIPINPSLVIAPSIHTTSTAVQAPILPIDPVIINPGPKETEDQLVVPKDPTTPIQPLHTHVDVPSVKNLEESVSKMHTDITSSLVPIPVDKVELPHPVDIKVETPVVETPKVVEEIVVQPIPEPPSVITSVIDLEPVPVVEPPALVPEVETPSKTGPAGLLMRGTRFVLYFGSVMLQLLSQMISHGPLNLNQLTEPLALR